MHSHVQLRKLVHVSGVHRHVRASSTSGCDFAYFSVQYCCCATQGATNEDLIELEAHRKNEERQEEEVTEELKRFTTQEMAVI